MTPRCIGDHGESVRLSAAACRGFLHAPLTSPISRLKAFLEEKQFSKQCGGQPLASYLSKPTQRLCKYPLLLRELLKNTPAGHPDRAPVEEAARQIDVVVKSVNEARRRIEQSQAIYAIQARLDTQEVRDLLLCPAVCSADASPSTCLRQRVCS